MHALGQILLELVTLERRFDDHVLRSARRSVREVVPNIPDIVERVMAGMMAMDPRDRP